MKLFRTFLALVVAAAVLSGPSASAATPTLEVALVGDSVMAITPGVAGQLDALLTTAGVDHHITNLAIPGATCADWAAPGALNAAVALHADLYVVDGGTNDGKFPALYATGVIDASLHTIYATLLGTSPTAKVLPTYIEYSAGYTGWQTGQGFVNDGVWRQTTNSPLAPRLITPAVPLGFIPETLLIDGGHPGPVGFAIMAGYLYRSLRLVYGWSDIAPQPCGMDGHRVNDVPYPQGTYIPCTTSWGT